MTQDSTPGERTPHTDIDSYPALALQMRCRAINGCASVADARASIMKTIQRCARQVHASRLFLATFGGQGPRLVVLPEYFLTSFPMGESIAQWQAMACISADGPEYEALGKIAQDNKLFLSGNAYELDPHFTGLYFQTSFIIDDSGELVLRYRRLVSMFAPTPHDVLDDYLDHYGSEALFPVADTAIGRLACVASEEILYPEISRALALKGAEVICHSSSEVSSNLATPKNIAKQARAFENMVYVVSANSGGISGIGIPENSTDGHSQVVDFRGKVLAEARNGESLNGNGMVHIKDLRTARGTPAMTNMLARQRLDLFSGLYGGEPVHPPNGLLDGGEVKVPGRAWFMEAQQAVIQRLRERGVI
jgi:predicted amidohydrolase